jgi:hypothetical protein
LQHISLGGEDDTRKEEVLNQFFEFWGKNEQRRT